MNDCGLQCPGTILQLKQAIDKIKVGEAVSVTATDPGFVADAPACCNTTGHELASLEPTGKGGVAMYIDNLSRSSVGLFIS